MPKDEGSVISNDTDGEDHHILEKVEDLGTKLPDYSLYTKKLDRRFKGNQTRKTLLHRSFVIMHLKDIADRKAIGEYYERHLRQYSNTRQIESITGIMLIYNTIVIHVFETCEETTCYMIRELLDQLNQEGGLFSDARILLMSNDIPDRLYPSWTFRVLNFAPPQPGSYEHENFNRLVLDAVTQLLRLGVTLKTASMAMSETGVPAGEPDLHEFYPGEDIIQFLCSHHELMAPKNFIQIYDTPYDVINDSDLVWPAPSRLFPYT